MELRDIYHTYLALAAALLGISCAIIALSSTVLQTVTCDMMSTCHMRDGQLQLQIGTYEYITRLDTFLLLATGCLTGAMTLASTAVALKTRIPVLPPDRNITKFCIKAPFWPGLFSALWSLGIFIYLTISANPSWTFDSTNQPTVFYTTEAYVCSQATAAVNAGSYDSVFAGLCSKAQASRFLLIPLWIFLPFMVSAGYYYRNKIMSIPPLRKPSVISLSNPPARNGMRKKDLTDDRLTVTEIEELRVAVRKMSLGLPT